MNEFFTNMQRIARTQRLSQNEKQAMRVRLTNYFEAYPVEEAPVVEKPRTSVPSPFYFFAPRYSVSFAALLLLILGGGTTFAAEGTLPGDTLYPLKINVNERVATTLALSPQAKAQVNGELATARLEEAETLASNGKLDAPTSAALTANFAMHVKAAQTNTSDLVVKDPGTAEQLNAQLDSNLSAHGAILAQIGDDSDNSDTKENSNAFAAQVRENQHGGTNADAVLAIETSAPNTDHPTNGARIRTSATTSFAPQAQTFAAASNTSSTSGSASTTPPAVSVKMVAAKKMSAPEPSPVVVHNPKDAKATASLGVQASSSLKDTGKDFAALTTLDAATSAQIASQIDAANQLYAEATMAFQNGNISDAKDGYASVLRLSIKLDTYLKAGKKFNVKILTGLLGNGQSINTSQNSSGKGDSEKSDSSTSGSVKQSNTQTHESTTAAPATLPTHGGDSQSSDNTDNVEGDVTAPLHL
jgi:hypothetical protein